MQILPMQILRVRDMEVGIDPVSFFVA